MRRDVRAGREPGCGKTTLGRSILRLEKPQSGQVIFDGEDVLSLPPGRLKQVRRNMQAIFQDPHGSLDPRMTVRQVVGEGLVVQDTMRRVLIIAPKSRIEESRRALRLSQPRMSRE